jgi:hypothetical protein
VSVKILLGVDRMAVTATARIANDVPALYNPVFKTTTTAFVFSFFLLLHFLEIRILSSIQRFQHILSCASLICYHSLFSMGI